MARLVSFSGSEREIKKNHTYSLYNYYLFEPHDVGKSVKLLDLQRKYK